MAGSIELHCEHEGPLDMRSLEALGRLGDAFLPGEIPTLADAENATETMHGECLFRLIDEVERHRLLSRAKKAVARFRI